MAKKVSFSSKKILICFLFFILIHKYALIQNAAADSRKLEDIPQNTISNSSSSSSNTTEEGKGQSKTGVRGSESRHSGSAAGDSPPNSAGTVQTPPPAGLTKVNYVTPTRNQNNGAPAGGGNYNYGGGINYNDYNYGGGINYNDYGPPPLDYPKNDDSNNSGWP